MSDSDVKYFWRHANQLTYFEMREVAQALQESKDDDFDFDDTNQLMLLLASVSSSQDEAQRGMEREEAKAREATRLGAQGIGERQ